MPTYQINHTPEHIALKSLKWTREDEEKDRYNLSAVHTLYATKKEKEMENYQATDLKKKSQHNHNHL